MTRDEAAPLNLLELEERARAALDPMAFDYYAGGAHDELTLGRNRAARACIDLSDGLGDAVHQLAAASDIGARIDADALPIHPAARAWCTASGADAIASAISGGDDYELVFTAPPSFGGRLTHVKRQLGDLAITAVGVVTKDKAVVLRQGGADAPLPSGFEHFRPA